MPAYADQITLLMDTREKDGWQKLFQTPCVRGTLQVGDYSVAGLESLISIERKSLSDLLGSLTAGRERFEREMKLGRHLAKFYLLIECNVSDLLVNDFGSLSKATPQSIWGSLWTWSHRYHVQILFGNDRQSSARLCEAVLVAFAKEAVKLTDRMERASGKVSINAINDCFD